MFTIVLGEFVSSTDLLLHSEEFSRKIQNFLCTVSRNSALYRLQKQFYPKLFYKAELQPISGALPYLFSITFLE